ncbi:MAG TPA: polysaccharide deacetylase family protein [Gallionellaceae bacterium]
MKPVLILLALLSYPLAAAADPLPVEIHDQLAAEFAASNKLALTLDACSGKFDDDLIQFLIDNQIPATIFATKRWLDENPAGLAVIKAHLDLFDVEDHGERHIPAVIGAGRKVYGIPGEPDIVHLRREVTAGALAVREATGVAPHWYRGATAEYDPKAIAEIGRLGYKIAGFSVNADNGATLKKVSIEKRLKHVKGGDVIIAHMNKPASDSAKGLAVGLAALLKQGFVFVRLDQVTLTQIPMKPLKSTHHQTLPASAVPAARHE